MKAMKAYVTPSTDVMLLSASAYICGITSPNPEEQPEGSGQLAPYRY